MREIRFETIRAILGVAGADIVTRPTFQTHSLLNDIDSQFRAMTPPEQDRFLRISTEEILRRQPDLEPSLRYYLERLGWTLYEGKIVQVEVLDISELPELPEEAHTDLLKGAIRFRDGDLSGALAAACGAVDSACARIYAEKQLGDPTKAQSLQERINKALHVSGAFITLEAELSDIGWEKDEAQKLVQNLRQSLNQAAYVMQTLRNRMSDVHGSKPALKAVVFDSLKWSTIIASLLK
jgi:hypothetical protein